MRWLRRTVPTFVTLAVLAFPLAAQRTRVIVERNVEATMRDGVVLRADISRGIATTHRAHKGQGSTTGLGYSPDALRRQRAREAEFRAIVSAERLGGYHAGLTRRPHMAGTEGARVVADSIVRWLRTAGLQVEVLEYRPLLSYPDEIAVWLLGTDTSTLRVDEPASALDPDTRHTDLGPGFVAYAASGDVTAPVIYVNYGLPNDYAQLAARKVDVRGKIVLARYGRSHRAVKLFTAEQRGAAGIILYNDPADDGYARGDTWPDGYWRTSEQLQRGNGKYSWHWHGDPLTPGTPALAGGTRLDAASAPTLPHIPAAVLSWGQARRILDRLGGDTVPAAFRGALRIPYRLGDGAGVRVRLRVRMRHELRTIRNVVARVPGARQSDRTILLGTHHDAWTFGGVDPGTGTATLLEVARSLGQLRHRGWQPERTIAFAFWDAEEFGLIGSTEYAEHRSRQLREGTICYINTDLYTNGRLDAGGAPSLRDFLVDVARDVPEGDGTVYDAWRASSGAEPELKALGSGADFVPFQDFLGLPTLSLEYKATSGYSYGPYHSNYDTRRFVERVADPGFQRGAQLARLLGTVALRLGESQILPFRFSHYARRLDEFVAAAERWSPDSAPGRPFPLDYASLRTAAQRAAENSRRLEARIDSVLARGQPPRSARSLNDLLARMEQRLLDETQRPDQRWYRHLVYGWNIYSLYDGQPFPGLAEAIQRGDRVTAERELTKIEAGVRRLADGLAEALPLADARP